MRWTVLRRKVRARAAAIALVLAQAGAAGSSLATAPLIAAGGPGVAVAVAAVAALAAADLARAQDPKATAAQGAARDWLVIVDTGDTAAAYKAAGDRFRKRLTPTQWDQALRKGRSRTGPMAERTLQMTRFMNQSPQKEPGEFSVVVFSTRFAKGSAVESIHLERGADGRWRVIGYALQ